MIDVTYAGEKARYDESAGRVWSLDGGRFAVVEECPVCGQLVGTGIGYRADEPEYCVAGACVDRALGEHLRFAHPEIFED